MELQVNTPIFPTQPLIVAPEVHVQPLRQVQKYVYDCPNCNVERTGLGDRNQNATYGPWGCDNCGYHYNVEVKDGEVLLTQVDKFNDVNHYYSLLGLATAPEILVIHKSFVTPDIKPGEQIDVAKFDENQKYYYNTHTCPTNWLRGIEYIIEGDDWDSHGVFQHIQTIRSPEFTDFMKLHENYHPTGLDELRKFFPRLVQWEAGTLISEE